MYLVLATTISICLLLQPSKQCWWRVQLSVREFAGLADTFTSCQLPEKKTKQKQNTDTPKPIALSKAFGHLKHSKRLKMHSII